MDNARRRTRGRPQVSTATRRHNRVVTFVTDSEFEQLAQLASRYDRSLSAIVHGMIAEQLPRYKDEGRPAD